MKIFGESTLTNKGEIAVPEAVQQVLHLEVGDYVAWNLNAQGELVVSASRPPYTLTDIRAAVSAAGSAKPRKGITVEKMKKGIVAHIRGKHARGELVNRFDI